VAAGREAAVPREEQEASIPSVLGVMCVEVSRLVRSIFGEWMIPDLQRIFLFWSRSVLSNSKPNTCKLEWSGSLPPNS
jgi:hypothetical protein